MLNNRTIWVYEYKPDQWLFRGNPNVVMRPDFPPCHLGGLYEIARGHELIHGETRKGLEMEMVAEEWNLCFPQFKVKPRQIVLSWHYYNRPKKGSEAAR